MLCRNLLALLRRRRRSYEVVFLVLHVGRDERRRMELMILKVHRRVDAFRQRLYTLDVPLEVSFFSLSLSLSLRLLSFLTFLSPPWFYQRFRGFRALFWWKLLNCEKDQKFQQNTERVKLCGFHQQFHWPRSALGERFRSSCKRRVKAG